jgi:hypothetical protein
MGIPTGEAVKTSTKKNSGLLDIFKRYCTSLFRVELT